MDYLLCSGSAGAWQVSIYCFLFLTIIDNKEKHDMVVVYLSVTLLDKTLLSFCQ